MGVWANWGKRQHCWWRWHGSKINGGALVPKPYWMCSRIDWQPWVQGLYELHTLSFICKWWWYQSVLGRNGNWQLVVGHLSMWRMTVNSINEVNDGRIAQITWGCYSVTHHPHKWQNPAHSLQWRQAGMACLPHSQKHRQEDPTPPIYKGNNANRILTCHKA